jgi:hypothetical protein
MWRRFIPLILALFCATSAFGFDSSSPGGAVTGGTCTGGQFMSGLSNTGTPICSTPSGGAPFPPGSPPQIGGYSALNTGEAETVGGDFTYARSGANAYTATVTKTNGVAFTGLATAAIPLSVANGGLAVTTAPAAGQLPIAQSATAYAPITVGGDATLSATGSLIVTKTNGVAFTGLATAAIPLSIANGGEGSSTAPTAGQIRVAASATSFPPVSMSGDTTITTAGVVTVGGLKGTTVPTLASGYLHFTGAAFVWDTPAVGGSGTVTSITAGTGLSGGNITTSGTIALITPVSIANGGTGGSTAPVANQILVASSATVLAPQTVGGDATLSGGTLTVTKTNGVAFGSLATASTVSDALLTSAYSGVGACAANTWASTLTRNAAPTCTQPAFSNLSGTVTDAQLANAYSGVGTCTAGQFVTTLGRNAAPTCATPAGSGLPTGTAPQFVGYTAGGAGEAETLGGDATLTRFAANQYNLKVTATNGVAFTALATAAIPLSIANGGTGSTTQNFLPINNPTATGLMTTPQLLLTTAGSTSLWLGSATTPWASFMSTGAGNFNFAAGAHFTGSWQADAASALLVAMNAGQIQFYDDTGLTAGTGYSPTLIAAITTSGLVLPTTSGASQIWFGSATTPSDTISPSSNQIVVSANSHNNGSAWVADATSAAMFNVTTPGTGAAFYYNSGLTAGSTYTPTVIASITPTYFNIQAGSLYEVGGAQIKTTNLADAAKNVGWTPVLEFGGATTGITYAQQYGIYWRVGSLVFANFGIQLSSKGTATGSATVCGLPFTIPNSGTNFGFWPFINFGTLTGLASGQLAGVYFGGNGGNCFSIAAQNQTSATSLTNSNFGGAENLQGAFLYATNDP